MIKSLKVSFLNGPTLAYRISQFVISCHQIDICIAFIKIKGLRRLLTTLEGLINRGGKVRIVFGISSKLGITDMESVKELLEFSKHKNVNIRRYDNSSFHPKAYLFYGKRPALIIGSSNLTNAAATKNVEANLFVEDADKQLFEDVKQFFNDCFDNADPLTHEDLKSYQPIKDLKKEYSKDTHEDSLPKQLVFNVQGPFKNIGELLNRYKKNRFYIMHLSYGKEGHREECWQYATKHDVIGLSNSLVDGDWAELRDGIKHYIDSTWIGQFDRFCENMSRNSMEIGDFVFILWGQSYLLGIAEIVGNHEYSEEYGEEFFDHIRPVRWIVEYDHENKIKIPKMDGFVNTLDLVRKNSQRWFKLNKVRF